MDLADLAAPPPPQTPEVEQALKLEHLKAFARATAGRTMYLDEVLELTRLARDAGVDIDQMPAGIPRPPEPEPMVEPVEDTP